MTIEYPLVVPPLAARAYAEATRIGFGADGGVLVRTGQVSCS